MRGHDAEECAAVDAQVFLDRGVITRAARECGAVAPSAMRRLRGCGDAGHAGRDAVCAGEE